MPNTYCYFDITIGGQPLKERVVMELFDDTTPKTCENFRKLCLGNDGKMVEGTSTPMTYKGCTFHRVIAGFMIQGGDFTRHDGTGGVSIYGEKFEDENFDVACEKSGLLAMANAGPGTNGSQFFITAAPTPHLTGRHVVFGRVVRGINAVRAVEHTSTGANDKPVADCVIADCGVLDALPPAEAPADGDTYTDYPEDCEPPAEGEAAVAAGEAIRQIGNELFKTQKYEEAMAKYSKAIRYLEKAAGGEEMSQPVNEKVVACHNNTAMCALKLGQWSAAKSAASAVISMDENNAKAFFRRGSAALNGGDADMAVQDLTRAHQLEPDNADVLALLNQAKEQVKAKKAKLAANLKKMFS